MIKLEQYDLSEEQNRREALKDLEQALIDRLALSCKISVRVGEHHISLHGLDNRRKAVFAADIDVYINRDLLGKKAPSPVIGHGSNGTFDPSDKECAGVIRANMLRDIIDRWDTISNHLIDASNTYIKLGDEVERQCQHKRIVNHPTL